MMDKEFDDARFWLPPEFLNEDDLLTDFNSGLTMKRVNSDLTESESDEEDYLNELSRKLAQYTLEDTPQSKSKSVRVMAGSPQSTLCGFTHVSSRGSSDCTSPGRVSQVEPNWDVLCAAASEVARLRKAEEAGRISSPDLQFQQQLLKQQLVQQQIQYQQIMMQSRVRNGGGNVKPVGFGMRALFLGNSNGKRECTGTGVFLPRQSVEPVKKPGYSTVLLPERVVHDLNQNLEAQSRSNGGLARYDYEAEMRYRNNVLMAEHRRQQAEMDLRLPQEWTY